MAVVLAVAALKEGSVKRIILTRPAVEAGESLGFLPGDLQEKVDPYLRPLYDALYDVMGPDQTAKALERGLIEIAPLAYMRGRTLDDSFIILDEAQNTTPEQMKMFLTRLGFGSKMVITGDVTQIDLPRGKKSGLIEAKSILSGIEEVGFVYFAEQDVVRHSLVQKSSSLMIKQQKTKIKGIVAMASKEPSTDKSIWGKTADGNIAWQHAIFCFAACFTLLYQSSIQAFAGTL